MPLVRHLPTKLSMKQSIIMRCSIIALAITSVSTLAYAEWNDSRTVQLYLQHPTVQTRLVQNTPKVLLEPKKFTPLSELNLRPRNSCRDGGCMDIAIPMHGAPPASTLNQRGIYVSANTFANEQKIDGLVDTLVAKGGNALIVDVKGSFVYFENTTSELAKELDLHRPLYELPSIIKRLKERHPDLYILTRFVAVKDQIFSTRNPEVQIRHPETNVSVGNVWVDASHPLTLEYNRQVIKDIVLAGVDEINLDYIRYPTEYAQYRIGLTGEQKAQKILEFIKMARKEIDTHGPEVLLGISTYPILGWNFPVNVEPLGQDFVLFEPYVDVISPMAYPASFSEAGGYYNPAVHGSSRDYWLVYRTLTGYAELLGDNHTKIRPWIQGYYMTATRTANQIKAVYDAGYCGFTFWNASNYYTPVFSGMYPEVPEHCL
jgi:hypothetical protein